MFSNGCLRLRSQAFAYAKKKKKRHVLKFFLRSGAIVHVDVSSVTCDWQTIESDGTLVPYQYSFEDIQSLTFASDVDGISATPSVGARFAFMKQQVVLLASDSYQEREQRNNN